MKTDTDRMLSTRLFMDTAFLPLSTSFVEKGALALGLGEKEALALTLATEEIFAYLCRIGSPDQGLEIRCSSGHYYIRIDFSCPVEDFNMRLFNLTATVSPEDEASLEQMGLLIASRFVDRLHVKQVPGQGILLSMIKEKTYPAIRESTPPPAGPLDSFSLKKPDPETLKLLVQLIHAHYPGRLLPQAFRFPGKVVDMVEGGDYEASVAVDPGGRIGGGMVWHWANRKTVECFGPYLFGQEPESLMSEALLEACIGAIAKTHAVGLVNLLPTKDLPGRHFEVLGTWFLIEENGAGTDLTAFFRQMREDPGTTSWCHPELEPFLRSEYGRLVLPREIHLVKDLGETKNPFSVLSAELDRSRRRVTLRPLRSGRDISENLENHLKLFSKESLPSVFFETDVGVPWQADFTPVLLRTGFTPRVVIPYGGEGDMVFFQLGTKRS